MSRIPSNINAPTTSHRMRRVGAVIDAVCWVVLLLVMVTVILGMIQRARFEHSYIVGVVVAIIGALVMLIGLAQQAIAARDLATWREMATWQLRAARQRVLKRHGEGDGGATSEDGMSDPYVDVFSDVMVEEILSQMEGRGDHA